MLDLIFKILSVLGIILLALVVLLLAALLLVLFFPVTYRISGRKTVEKMELSAKLNWLFGLFRVRCSYPEPGVLTAKLLWFKLYQTKLPPDSKDGKDKKEKKENEEKIKLEQAAPAEEKAADSGLDRESKPGTEDKISGGQEQKALGQEEIRTEEASGQGMIRTEEASRQKEARTEEAQEQGGSLSEEASGQEETGAEEPRNGFFEKIHKIKYTICSIYDKIKEIWKNISYYTALLQEENTRQLWAYVKLLAAKILKNIRPRHIRADILFGTGSPDTTGYVFGMYCMFYPVLGAEVLVTPDFERAVLEGRIDISGHITVFVLLVNVVRLMLDKKLRLFIRKLKKEDVGHTKASHHKKVSHHKKALHHKKASQKGGASH